MPSSALWCLFCMQIRRWCYPQAVGTAHSGHPWISWALAMKWKIKRTLMFRKGCYSYAKCFAQWSSLRFRLNEHYASLQGAVFCFLLRFPAGLMPMASASSRGVAGTMAGSCHSPLFLLPIRKCVQWSVLVTFCFWLVQVFWMNIILLSCIC